MKSILITLAKYGIGLGLLAYIITTKWDGKYEPSNGIDPPKLISPGLGEALEHPISIPPFIAALVISAIGLILTFLRWHLLVVAVGIPFTRYQAIRFGLIGYFFNTFLPGSVGGDIIKAVGIARDQSRRTLAVATVAIDRVIGLWALFWFVAILGGSFYLLGNRILLENENLVVMVRWSVLFVAVSTLIWVLIGYFPDHRADQLALKLAKIPKVGGSLSELWRGCWIYRKKPLVVFYAIVISMIGHAGWVLVFHLSAQVFYLQNPNERGTFVEHILIAPFGMTAQAVIPTPGGVGGGEAAYGFLYELIHKPGVNGILASLAQRAAAWILGLGGYLIYLRMRSSIVREAVPVTQMISETA